MRVIKRKTLKEFYSQPAHSDAEALLEAWYHEAKHAHWKTPADIKQHYASVSILKNNRVVFNIGGNKYRLVVKINYAAEIILIRFIGTHAGYDQIDAEEV